MNKLWDDLKDNMKEWGASAVEKAEEMSRVAVAKGEEFTKISKIKIEIHQLTKEKNKEFEKLGNFTYNHTKIDSMANFTGNTEFFHIVTLIDEFDLKIESKKNEIEVIKEEYGIDEYDIQNELTSDVESEASDTKNLD